MSWRPKLRTEYQRPGHKLAWDRGYSDGRVGLDQERLERGAHRGAYHAGYEHGRTATEPPAILRTTTAIGNEKHTFPAGDQRNKGFELGFGDPRRS